MSIIHNQKKMINKKTVLKARPQDTTMCAITWRW